MSYMPYLLNLCVSTKKMVAGQAHKKNLKKTPKMKIIQIKIIIKNNQANLPNTAYLSNQIWQVGVNNANRIIQK